MPEPVGLAHHQESIPPQATKKMCFVPEMCELSHLSVLHALDLEAHPAVWSGKTASHHGDAAHTRVHA
jgi:hypothetical protein